MDNTSHSHSNPKLEADIKLAKHLYFDEYKSDDPNLQDHAEKELHHLHETDPRALRIALKQIDAQEKAQREQNVRDRDLQMQIAKEQLATAQERAASAQAQSAAIAAERASEAPPPAAAGAPTWSGDAAVAAPSPPPSGDAAAAAVAAGAPPPPAADAPPPPAADAPPPPAADASAQPGVQPPADNEINGYAPNNVFGLPAPKGRAFEAAYERDNPDFHDVNILGLLKLGYSGKNHSLHIGPNFFGLAKADFQVGGENRVSFAVLPYANSPLYARGHVGFGFNGGLHADAGGGAHVLGIAGVDGDGNGYIDNSGIGTSADVQAQALHAFNGHAGGGAALDQNGVHGYTGGGADIAGQVGLQGGGDASVGTKTGFDGGVGGFAGDTQVNVGPQAYSSTDGTSFAGINAVASSTKHPSFQFTGNRDVDQRYEADGRPLPEVQPAPETP